MTKTTRRGLKAFLYAATSLVAGTAFGQYQPAHQQGGAYYQGGYAGGNAMQAGPAPMMIGTGVPMNQNGQIRQVAGTMAATVPPGMANPAAVSRVAQARSPGAAAPTQSVLVGPGGLPGRTPVRQGMRVADGSMMSAPMMNGTTVMAGGVPGGVTLGPGETIVGGDYGGMPMNGEIYAPNGMMGGMQGGYVENGYSAGNIVSGGYVGDGYSSGGCADGSCGMGGVMAQRPLFNGIGNGQVIQRMDDMMPAAMRIGNLCVFGGASSFTGPSNLGSSGSYGFNEGLIYSAPVLGIPEEAISFEAGARFVQANFGGTIFSQDNRNQIFGTVGLFRRVDCGLQGGVVADYFHEDWYTQTDLVQLRGEVSYIYPQGVHEIGFYGTLGLNKSGRDGQITIPNVGTINPTFDSQSLDTYNAFYRAKLANGGSGRVVLGVSELSQFLVGADFETPLSDRIAIDSSFRYIIPNEFNGLNILNAQPENLESWNVNVGLRICLDPRRMCGGYHRALLPVADNGTFFVNRSIR